MYIYELPFAINKELCRLLDINDYWKDLAGEQMKYSPFDINEIEQVARRYTNSPTHQLFIKWGQLNHKVEELFILLYHMKYVPALQCLTSVVDKRFHRLLQKLDNNNKQLVKKEVGTDETGDIKPTIEMDKKSIKNGSASIPLPVMLVQQGRSKPSTNGFNSPAVDSSTDMSSSRGISSGEQGNGRSMRDAIKREVASIPMISYEELVKATNGWSQENLLGRGGFGQVFKGEWKHLPVAVKKLKGDEGRELVREMSVNQYRHDNILPLYGYSIGGPEACLVYQKMAGGSLEQRLRGKSRLSWPQRYKVAHGVARGLQYLHTLSPTTPLIHGDIKPANILLDQCMEPKIADFGLARKGVVNRDFLVSKVYGTRPYLPEEYLQHNILSPAVDVYSFGVVLLEMATALLPAIACVDRPRQYVNLCRHIRAMIAADPNLDLASLEDKILRSTDNSAHSKPELCKKFIEIGLHCTQEKKGDRPEMETVYKVLNDLEFDGKPIM